MINNFKCAVQKYVRNRYLGHILSDYQLKESLFSEFIPKNKNESCTHSVQLNIISVLKIFYEKI